MRCRNKYIARFTAAFLLFSFAFGRCPVSGCRVIGSVRCERKIAALTFDDGPHPEYTEEILDILAEYGVRATFFVVGECAEIYPDIVKRELAEGHEVENHTYSHLYFSKCGEREIEDDIEKAEDVMDDMSSYRFNFIRPPGGIITGSLDKFLREKSYDVVLWSVDTKDWTSPGVSSVVNAVMNNIRPGDIILMHDFVSGRSSTPDALRQIIPALIADGYDFVTVSELVSFSDASFDE